MKRIDVGKTAVALLGLTRRGKPGQFLGTAFFAGTPARVVTTNHNLASWDGDYGIGMHVGEAGSECPYYAAHVVARDSEADLAILESDSSASADAFPLADDSDIVLNKMICSYEYSQTSEGAHGIRLAAASRMGNVVRRAHLIDLYGRAGESALELSFPALRGASGAPVVDPSDDFKVWGIIKANVSHHLLPAQIEAVADVAGEITEQTQFLLPQAIAVHVKHLRKLLSGLA